MSPNSSNHKQTEKEFLKSYDPAAFDRPSVAVDVAALSTHQGYLWALLIKRRQHPFSGTWALPGSFVKMDESLEQAGLRLLATETGLSNVFLEQLYTFGQPKRDPRTRVISVAYYALVDWRRLQLLKTKEEPQALRLAVNWPGETGGPVQVLDAEGQAQPLAFDHADILGMAVKRIRGKLDYVPIGFQLLPPKFSLRQLQQVHETIMNQEINKDSFRRRMLDSGYLEATGEREQEVDHRPAELYRFVRRSAI